MYRHYTNAWFRGLVVKMYSPLKGPMGVILHRVVHLEFRYWCNNPCVPYRALRLITESCFGINSVIYDDHKQYTLL